MVWLHRKVEESKKVSYNWEISPLYQITLHVLTLYKLTTNRSMSYYCFDAVREMAARETLASLCHYLQLHGRHLALVSSSITAIVEVCMAVCSNRSRVCVHKNFHTTLWMLKKIDILGGCSIADPKHLC